MCKTKLRKGSGFHLSKSICGHYSNSTTARIIVLSASFGSRGTLDPKLLTAALHKVFARHEVLRSTFHCLPGAAISVQVITESSTPPIVNYDLSGYDPARQTAEIEALFGPASQSPFDFQKGSLCRISLVTLSCDNHILFLDLSSLCADTASFKNLVRDISRFYSACLGHEEPSNEPPQYADLAEWQNELLESEDTKTARDYWRQQDLLPLIVLKLPFEKPACRKPGFEPRFLTSTIGPDIAEKSESSSGIATLRNLYSFSLAGRACCGASPGSQTSSSAWPAMAGRMRGCRRRWGFSQNIYRSAVIWKSTFDSVIFWNRPVTRHTMSFNGRSILAGTSSPGRIGYRVAGFLLRQFRIRGGAGEVLRRRAHIFDSETTRLCRSFQGEIVLCSKGRPFDH